MVRMRGHSTNYVSEEKKQGVENGDDVEGRYIGRQGDAKFEG
jgi:hypothetical protein